MSRIQNVRGIVSAIRANANENPAALIGQLTDAFATFRNRNDERLAAMESALDQSARAAARDRIGGGGGRPATEQIQALGAFLRNGTSPQAGMRVGQGSDGGFLTDDALDNMIHEYASEQSAMRRIASRRTVEVGATGFKTWITTDRAAHGGWVGEQTTRTETDAPKLGELSIPLHEHYAEPRSTQRLLDDSNFDIEAYLQNEITWTLGTQEDIAFVTGDGSNKPEGFLSLPTSSDDDGTRSHEALQYVPTGATGDFLPVSTGVLPGDCLIDLMYKVNAEYRRNGTWLMNSATAARIRKFKDADGNYLWQRSVILGQPDMLLGYPVVIDENMPDIASGTYSIAFGDFRRGYLIIDRAGTEILRDPYTTKGWVKFYATKRTGGGVVDRRAIKLLKFSAS